MAESNAIIGYGTLFAIGNGATPTEVFQTLAEVRDLTPPSDTLDVIETTHMTSPNRIKEFAAGLLDPGECSFTIHFLPGEADDDLIQALRGGAKRNFRITFPAIGANPRVTWTFRGFLVGYEPDVPTNEVMTAQVRIKVTGPYTPGTAA
jgi:hypothetical protein